MKKSLIILITVFYLRCHIFRARVVELQTFLGNKIAGIRYDTKFVLGKEFVRIRDLRTQFNVVV